MLECWCITKGKVTSNTAGASRLLGVFDDAVEIVKPNDAID